MHQRKGAVCSQQLLLGTRQFFQMCMQLRVGFFVPTDETLLANNPNKFPVDVPIVEGSLISMVK